MSLYNLWRPSVFDEVIGNSATVKALKNFIKQAPDKRPHTYMFVGPTGCGKTTLSRIFANALGCSKIDLVELNAANTRGIDTVREVVETSLMAPLSGKARVFIFDESHQLTKPAQESLLKVIEDVPVSSYFIFCTTNPENLLATIKNRCNTFQVQPFKDEESQELIEKILVQLGKDLTDNVFFSLIDSATGCPRQLLVMLEQILNVETEEEQLSLLVRAQIETQTLDLCRAIVKRVPWTELAEIYKALPNKDNEAIRRSILGYMKSILLKGGNLSALSAMVIEVLEPDTYDSGEPGLVRMLYETTLLED